MRHCGGETAEHQPQTPRLLYAMQRDSEQYQKPGKQLFHFSLSLSLSLSLPFFSLGNYLSFSV